MMITPADSAPQEPGQMPASGWDIQAPYAAGDAGHVQVHGDPDPGGHDRVSGTVDGAVAAAMARQAELQSDTYGPGSTIGDMMTLPPNHLDPGVGTTGTTDPSGGLYDPPRDYGG
jgi:hypothetical protein